MCSNLSACATLYRPTYINNEPERLPIGRQSKKLNLFLTAKEIQMNKHIMQASVLWMGSKLTWTMLLKWGFVSFSSSRKLGPKHPINSDQHCNRFLFFPSIQILTGSGWRSSHSALSHMNHTSFDQDFFGVAEWKHPKPLNINSLFKVISITLCNNCVCKKTPCQTDQTHRFKRKYFSLPTKYFRTLSLISGRSPEATQAA